MKLKALFFIAVIGFIFNFLTHFLTYFGLNLQKNIPYIQIINLGFSIIFLLSLFDTGGYKGKYKGDDNDNLDMFLKGIKSLPRWMKVSCVITFIYSSINIAIISGLIPDGVPLLINGKYELIKKNKVSINIDLVEYIKIKTYEMRISSGQWMSFYFISATVLYSKIKEYLHMLLLKRIN